MKRNAIIFDMDGTLADVSGIRHWVIPTAQRRWKAFDKFHEESVNVPANEWVVDLAREWDARGVDVVVVTARRALWRHHTAWWLALHGVPSAALFMRGVDDGRRDYLVKRDILARITQTWNVVHAVDDNPSVLDLWREAGIPTTVVPGWEV
jgi:beta-phosphoglucomutase-like phosphatase (HAD superfamily)